MLSEAWRVDTKTAGGHERMFRHWEYSVADVQPVEQSAPNWILLLPVTEQEVQDNLVGGSRVPGSDGVSWRGFKVLGKPVITALCNAWLPCWTI